MEENLINDAFVSQVIFYFLSANQRIRLTNKKSFCVCCGWEEGGLSISSSSTFLLKIKTFFLVKISLGVLICLSSILNFDSQEIIDTLKNQHLWQFKSFWQLRNFWQLINYWQFKTNILTAKKFLTVSKLTSQQPRNSWQFQNWHTDSFRTDLLTVRKFLAV